MTDDELYAFGERHGLCPEPKDKNFPEALRRYEVYQAAVKLLSKKAGWPLELHNPINPFLHWTVTVYSNYTLPVRRMSEEDETWVVVMILEELNLPEERDAFWHYDCFDGNVEMRLKPWEKPSEKVKQARGWHDRSTTMQTMIRSRRTIDRAKRVGTLENKPKLTRVILDCCEG